MTGVTTPDPAVAAVVSAVKANTDADAVAANQAHVDSAQIVIKADALETAVQETNSKLDDIATTLTAEETAVLKANANYAYSFTLNPDGTYATKTRTLGGVSETKTFTYDTNGNVTAVSAWV